VPALTGRAARRLLTGAALLGIITGGAASAGAQDVLMTAASGMPRGSFELTTYPVLIPQDDSEAGLFVRGAHGLTEGLAVRASVGFFNDLTYLGATGDLRLPRWVPVDTTLSLGLHRSGFEHSADILGFDVAVMGRHPAWSRGALYGGFDLDFELPEEPYDTFTRARLVAGVDFEIVESMRLLVEGGLGFNDRSPDYVSAGLAVRLR
jgi:hypothetical protein